jgi:superfamily II DNA helicase RecQ
VHTLVLGDEAAPSPYLDELDGSRQRLPATSGADPGGKPSDPTAGVTPAARRRRAHAGNVASGPDSEPDALETALRNWRRETASRSGVPAYVVLNDAELTGVAGQRPATLAELSRCRGMGPIRLERYGDEILAVIGGVTDEGEP